MPGWADRVDDLLAPDERVEWRESLDAVTFVVTTRRLLVFTPEGEGANYRAVDRPNVTGIERTTLGDRTWLRRAATPVVFGVVGLVASRIFVLDGMLALDAPTSDRVPGAGRVLGLFDTIRWVVDHVDEALLALGLGALALALVFAGTYVVTRRTVLRVAVAGDDDVAVRIPRNADGVDALAERLDATVRPDAPLDE